MMTSNATNNTSGELGRKILFLTCSILLTIYGVLISVIGLFFYSTFSYNLLLTVAIAIGLMVSIMNKHIGHWIVGLASVGWLLRYAMHTGYLLLFDFSNLFNWILVIIPFILAYLVFLVFAYRKYHEYQISIPRPFMMLSLPVLLGFGVLTYYWRTYEIELSCD
jgi:hypothetical protein